MHKKHQYKRFTLTAFFLLNFVLLTQFSYAQTRAIGRIFEYQTRTRIAGVKIENLKSHVIAVSDSGGRYAIKAVAGDRIVYSVFSYKSDTVLLTSLKYKEIFLELKADNFLKEVKIINKENNLGTLAVPIATPFGGNAVRYQTDANGNNTGGLKLSLPGFNGDAKKKERDAQRERDGETELQIDKIFSPENLQNYLPIKGQEMNNFILLYRPSIKVYRDKFNLTLYIDSCYKEFVKIPIDKRQAKDFMQLYSKP